MALWGFGTKINFAFVLAACFSTGILSRRSPICWLAGLELVAMLLLSRKIWFVVLVGLLLGLACGAVMAVWPSLRLAAALIAVVGAVVLGRAGGVGGWLSLSVAAVVAVFALRRWGANPWPMVAIGGLLGGVVFAWRSALLRDELHHVRGINTALSTELNAQNGVSGDGRQLAKPANPDRNASVHPNGAPKYQRLSTDKDTQIERLARLLHDAGRSAVEQGLTQNPSGGAFVEWDDALERTRAVRRSQAAYLLAAGVVWAEWAQLRHSMRDPLA